MFQYSNTNKRYHTFDYYLKQKYGCKVFKVSLNAGFSCPNRDGKKGTTGCFFCSSFGGGENGGNVKEDLQLIDIGKTDTLVKAEEFIRQNHLLHTCP